MLKNKKIFLIILISLILVVAIIFGILLIVINKNSSESLVEERTLEEIEALNEGDLENNFRKKFYNIQYTEDKNEIVSKGYVYEEKKDNQYSVNLNIPQINKETETVAKINKEIIDEYGNKLLDLMNGENDYTIYNVDFITYQYKDIVSIIIKTSLKEGKLAQRVAIQIYNYDIENDKIITLNDVLKENNINKNELQTKIINTIREKNANTKTLAEQGYNIYVRDIRSDEYLIENIKTFFIDEQGNVYLVFPYGNNNYTETMDVIIAQ